MAFAVLAGATFLVSAGCSSTPPPNDGGYGGGGGGTTMNANWSYYDLDIAAVDMPYLSVAYQSATNRLGAAYFANVGVNNDAGYLDAGLHDGTNNWEVRYVEWVNGTIGSKTVLATVQRPIGISLAFQNNGDPAVAWLGGDGFDGMSNSNYWFQSDPEAKFRSNGVWADTIPFTMSADIQSGDDQPNDNCANGVSVSGFLLGLWPSIAIDSQNKVYWAFRDCHQGQFPKQDWGGSDWKMAEGTPGAWTGVCIKAGGDDKQAWGGHTQMVIGANDQPAMIGDQIPLGPDNDGENIYFTQRLATGHWTKLFQISTVTNSQTGGTLAYDPTEGYGIAWVDAAASPILKYTNSPDGVSWTTATPIVGSGTSGWYPSLAMDPVHHEPAISYYQCSVEAGKSEANCTADDELDVRQRVSGNWQTKLVDDFGSIPPLGSNRVINKLGFFNDKRFVVYLPPLSSVLRLAVEK